MLDTSILRADFPILARKENGHRLVYLDNAATTQKPRRVLEAIVHYYSSHNANVHRGAYTLAVEATEAYEAARTTVGRFVNASFLSFESTRRFFPQGRAHVLGNPIRKALLENFLRSKHTHEKFTVLIFGGSLGARGINSRVLEALPLLESMKNPAKFTMVMHGTPPHSPEPRVRS